MNRRVALPLSLVVAMLAAGCGGAKALTPLQAVQAAAKTATATSSRIELSEHTTAQGQDFTLAGTGEFGSLAGSPIGEMTMTFGTVVIHERIVAGVLYLQLPTSTDFYRLPLSNLAGTQLADSSNPGSAAELLSAMGADTKRLGTLTLRGTKTTHYTGTIDVAKAKALAKTPFAAKAVQRLIDSGVLQIPVDVYLDDQGRVRRLVENFTLTVKGVPAQVSTQLDVYDFGVVVQVQPPPASQTKDGGPLLASLKSQLG